MIPPGGAQATPAIGCGPASTVAPLRGTSMREAVLIGPSLDHPRGIQKPSTSSHVVSWMASSHFVADT